MMNNVISKLKDPWHVNLWTDKVLYARKSGEVEELPENLLNGNKISVEDAIVSTVHPKFLLKENAIRIWRPCAGEVLAVFLTLSGFTPASSSTLRQRSTHLASSCPLGLRKRSKWSCKRTSSSISSSAPSRMESSRLDWGNDLPRQNQQICKNGTKIYKTKVKIHFRNSLLEPSDTIQRESLCSGD